MIPFIPRKVAKALSTHKFTLGPSPLNQRSLPVAAHDHKQSTGVPGPTQALPTRVKGKGKGVDGSGTYSDADYATLLCLSLSDHALWLDPDLRRTIEAHGEGYIPLSYLLHQSSFLATLDHEPSETVLVRSIRAHAANILEVRLLMSSPSRSTWYGNGPVPKNTLGGYEIRLKDWEDALHRARNSSRNDWEASTVYIENVPPSYRDIHKIPAFLLALLANSESPCEIMRIQRVSLPKHHLDKPEDIPKCKGFALVTFSHSGDVNFLLQKWSWERNLGKQKHEDIEQQSPEVQDAIKFGFRVLMKLRWDKLNEEYLAYRQTLLDAIAREQDTAVSEHIQLSTTDSQKEELVKEMAPTQSYTQLSPLASFPPGCLAYVRNVHPETNKTTLRKLLGKAYTNVQGAVGGDPIDYVDFNKGMDTCYIRLALPHHTETVIAHFSNSHTVQQQGLDAVGAPSADNGRKPLRIEAVTGEREELYWGRVPEKLRRQAVEKALHGCQPQDEDTQETKVKGRKRQRRK